MTLSKRPRSFAEPMPVGKLKERSVYYMVTCFDDEMLIPEIKTLIYLGKNIENDSIDSYYFQDYESYKEIGGFPQNRQGCGEVFALPEKGLINICDLTGVIEFLRRCAERNEQR